MEALKLKTVDDLILASVEQERIELIHGEIVKRPMARFNHGAVQAGISDEVSAFKRRKEPTGWWIATEVSVRYSEHHCPTHDLAGWRKSRLPERPTGIMSMLPDWVCEITSPEHERKDVFMHLLRLQTALVPSYWVISPEDKTLIAYELADAHYRVAFSIECGDGQDCQQLAIPPFAEQPVDLEYVFAGE